MTATVDTFISPADSTPLASFTWGADLDSPVGIVQIAHGAAERSSRYARLAEALVAAGYRVHAIDDPGHGQSIPEGGTPGDLGPAAFDGVIGAVGAFGASLAEGQDLPLFLIAHSMGSFAAQGVLLERPDLYRGVVLSGSTSLDVVAAGLAESEGPVGLEAFNAAFEHRTGYEWLSRDEAEVDKYMADPLCGFDLPDETLPALFAVAPRLADSQALAKIPDELPILLVSGQRDPIAGDGQLVELLGQRYRDAGLNDVTVRVYPDARHEIFNETNRDEITETVIGWLRDRT